MIVNKKITSFSKQEKIFLYAIFVSLCGDSLIPIAFALESLRIDPAGAGFTVILLSLWGGRFLGTLIFRRFRSSKLKKMMIISDVVRLIAQLGLCAWILLLDDSIFVMAVSSLIYGVATAFFVPSRFAATPKVVPENNIEKFNSLVNLLTDALMIAAPSISTAIFLWVGFTPILIFDAITFAIGIFILLSLEIDNEELFLGGKDDDSSKNYFIDFKIIPGWARLGLLVWIFITLIIGYSGVAGPSFVISRFSAEEWAVVATALAVGSIVGSASQLIGIFQKISWKLIQVLAGFLICLQIISFAVSPSLIVIILFSFVASLVMTSAGISWDTVIQKNLNSRELRIFANWDSLLTTGTVPLGMLIFGLGSLAGTQEMITIAITALCIISVIIFFLRTFSLKK